jgi:exosortase
MQKWQNNLRLGAFAAAVMCMLVGFAGMYFRLRFVFNDPLEDMSHGWLVPIFSLYVLWTQRTELKKEVGSPSIWGLLACLPCIGVALVGSRGTQVRFEQFGFIGLCIAMPWAFYGRRVAKKCVFPALFLLFSVPMATYFDTVTIYLRLIASGTAFVVLRGFGVDVAQVGTAIVSQGAHPFSIDVAEPCSGLRSLVALTALTAAYAWYTQPTWRRRAALFACAIPLAVLGNVARVLSICFVAVWTSSDFALGFYHDYSGYVVFVVAIALMVACGEVITRWCRKRKDARQRVPPATGETPVVPVSATGGTPVVPVVFAVVLCPLLLFQLITPEPVVTEPPKVVWPESLDGYLADDILYCQNESCSRAFLSSQIGSATNCPTCGGALDGRSLGENTSLPKDTTILKRVYTSGSGMQFTVSAVISGVGRFSIHRPELCLPGQGALMSSSTDLEVAGRPYHAIETNFRQDPPGQLMYTFFNQNEVRTSSHLRRILLDTWDRSVYNRIDRWVMVTVRAASPYGVVMSRPRDRAEVERFLRRIEEVLP